MRLSNLLESLSVSVNAKKINAAVTDECVIEGITADSRAVKAGYLFAALPGGKQDGTRFIADAVSNGAVAVLAPTGTSLPEIALQQHVILIESDNPRLELSRMASHFYPRQPDHIYGVTGTNGKTSVANFVAQLMALKGKKSASLGTLGLMSATLKREGAMTTLEPVALHQTLDECAAHGITHMGIEVSSHGLDQYRTDNVRFEAAGFTNLTQDHLDYHGTMEAYFQSKARLFKELLPAGSRAVINADDVYGRQLIDSAFDRGLTVIDYGLNAETIKILSQTPTPAGQTVHIRLNGVERSINLPLMGLFQAYNALCAFGLCGLDADDVALLERLKTVDGRMDYVGETHNGAHVYVDYAHTPDALETVLKAARPHTTNQLVVIFGCGGNRDKTKRPLMAKACGSYADRVILTDDNPRDEDPAAIRADAKAGYANLEDIGDRHMAIQQTIASLKTGDVLLITGKGHESGQTIKGVTHPFHDATVARLYLKKAGQS